MLKVTRQPPVTSEPAKGALDNPTSWQDREASHPFWTLNEFELPAQLLTHRFNNVSIGTIGPDQFEPTPTIMDTALGPVKQTLQNHLSARTVREGGTMHQDDQQQTQGVHDNMAFSARSLLVDINPTGFAAFRSLDTLAINDRRTGLRITLLLGTYLFHQRGIDPLPDSLPCPAPEVAIDRLPGRPVGRQHPPLTARAGNVQDGIHYQPQFPLAGSSTSGPCKEFHTQQPFVILEVGRVGLGEFGHSP